MKALDKAFEVSGGDSAEYGVYMPDGGGVHVMPEFGPEHEQVTTCWCHPAIEIHEDDHLVIHNVAH